MHIYIIVIMSIFLTLFISRKIKDNYKNISSKIIIVFAFIYMFLFAGLRFNVGTDYLSYVELFDDIISSPLVFNFRLEPVFIIISKVISVFTNNPLWLFVITSFIITIFIFKASIKSTTYYELSIFLFIAFGFYTSSFNIVRQWMAASILLYAYVYLNRNNNKKFFIYSLLAFCCHYSSIIIFPAYLFIKKTRSDKIRLLFMFLGILLYNLTDIIVRVLQTITLNIGILNKYYKYLNLGENLEGSMFVFPMFCVLTYILYLFFKKSINRKSINIEVYINALVVGFIVSMIGQKIMIFSRLQFFFINTLIIILPQIVYSMKPKNRIIFYSMFVILGIMFYLYSLMKNGGHPLPYRTILF